jgi:hypothetical protein
MTAKNAQAGFKATGLVPYDPESLLAAGVGVKFAAEV